MKEYEREKKVLEAEIEEKEKKILECTSYARLSLDKVSEEVLFVIILSCFGFGTF